MSPDSMDSGWFYAKAGATAGREIGPLSWEELYLLALGGSLSPTDIVWNPKLPRGVAAGLVPGLFQESAMPQTPQVHLRVQPALPEPVAQQPPATPVYTPASAVLPQTPAAPAPTAAPVQFRTEVSDYFGEASGEAAGLDMPMQKAKPPKTARRNPNLPWLVVVLMLVIAAAGVAAYFLFWRDADSGTTPTSAITTTVLGLGGTTLPVSSSPGVWSQLAITGVSPAARSYHAMAYDPTTNKTILFGGSNSESKFDDTWDVDLATNTWTERGATDIAPSPRDYVQMVLDPVGGSVILFGGSDDSGDCNDLWAYDPAAATWTELTPSGTLPPAREGHSMVYEPGTKRVLVCGGLNDETGELLSDLWAYDPAANSWTQLNAGGTPPAARMSAALAYYAGTQRVLLFGGLALGDSADTELNDMWAYDPIGNTWARITTAGSAPSARQGHAMVTAPSLGGLLLYGGRQIDTDLGETWIFDPTAGSWAQSQPTGSSPGARDGQAMAFDSTAAAVVLFGGFDAAASQDLGDAWVYRSPASTGTP